MRRPGPTLADRVHSSVRGLSPGYFAVVMATGIISEGLAIDGRRLLSRCLLVLAVVSFVALVVLNAWRFTAFRDAASDDFTSPARGFGFYTFVAAADVLAARIADVHTDVALWLLAVAAACWLLRGYAVPWTTRGGNGRSVLADVNGTWFLWAVGAQSVAVAAAVLAPLRGGTALSDVAVAGWFLGALLYLVTALLVILRLVLHDVAAEDVAPPFWVAMGATAITTLAGAEILFLPSSPFVDAAREVVRGGSLGAWVLATWLIPALCATGWWRHISHRVPLRYDADLWSIVFPLGMYAVASTRLGAAEDSALLTDIGRVWIWVALAAWALTLVAGAAHVVRRILLPSS
jgi:tellurite resistance protein TehA-like permease